MLLAKPDAAWLIDEAVRRFGRVQGAAHEACAGALRAQAVHNDTPELWLTLRPNSAERMLDDCLPCQFL